MSHPIPRAGILEIAPYVGGPSHAEGIARPVKLSSNENPWGPSEAAKAAYRAAADGLHRYPPGDHAALRAALGAAHGLDADRIICGAGSDELIAHACTAFSGPGDEVVHTSHGFALYPIAARAAGASPVEVAETDRRVDIDAIRDAVTARTRIVFVTNPGNPTATLLSAADLAALVDALPARVVLVLDGAYAEFADGYDGGAALAEARPNVLMLRTFSKLYGLGGLRVGWGYAAAPIIDALNRVRGPFNLGNGQLAAAEAALGDTAHTGFCLSETRRLRRWLTDGLRDLGLAVDEAHANFVLARFASPEAADAAEARLRADGLLVRKTAGYKLPQCLRISIGEEDACRRVLAVLAAHLEASA